MKLRQGDTWSVFSEADLFLITANATLTLQGKLVMGAGIAKEARDRFLGLGQALGKALGKAVLEQGKHYGAAREPALARGETWGVSVEIALERPGPAQPYQRGGHQVMTLVRVPPYSTGLPQLPWCRAGRFTSSPSPQIAKYVARHREHLGVSTTMTARQPAILAPKSINNPYMCVYDLQTPSWFQ